MKRLSLSLFPLLPFVAACSGGTSTVPMVASQTQRIRSAGQLHSDARSHDNIVASSGSSDKLYIGNVGNSSITVYHHDSRGNTAPLYVIAGPKTGISRPGQLSEDAQGNLYVANDAPPQSQGDGAILVFARGASGNVAPIRKIAGALTDLHSVKAMTVDKVTGSIFAFGGNSDPLFAPYWSFRLLRFAPNATGNVAPLAKSMPLETPVLQLTSDSTGVDVVTALDCAPDDCNRAGVKTFSKSFSSGQLPEVYSITDFSAYGVVDDATTRTYLASNFTGLYRFAQATVGNGGDATGEPPVFKPMVVSIVTNDTCSGQLAVPPGPTPYTYAVHGTNCPDTPSGAVYVYANTASGNATPVRILSGPATLMNQPYGIYEGQ